MTREMRLAATSARQLGAFTGQQAVAAGFPRRTVQRRVSSGVWERVVGDTYRVRGAPVSWEQVALAAWLAVGNPAAISHRSAAALWELGPAPPAEPAILVPRPRRPRVGGVELIETKRWGRLDVVRKGPFRLTSMPRTLVDLAPVLPELELEMALDRAHRQGMRFDRFMSYLRHPANRRLPGVRRLLEIAADRDPARPIESELETLLFAVLRRARLPLPVRQHWTETRKGRRRIDLAYPEHRLALEVVGFTFHEHGRAAFDDDKARDAELAEAGWDRRYLTKTKLEGEPDDVVWTVSRALGLVPTRWEARASGGTRRPTRSGPGHPGRAPA
ncbi:MAG TPA: type IV toxin-antitoxin system AbiEi family antitoxin domain-containing protein [Actinomycetota bacterium]|nr:type IV toxin-antitoxin system AbiEi family antitoxin domain-containing protein [Actinomycetota bacterium]